MNVHSFRKRARFPTCEDITRLHPSILEENYCKIVVVVGGVSTYVDVPLKNNDSNCTCADVGTKRWKTPPPPPPPRSKLHQMTSLHSQRKIFPRAATAAMNVR
ncbi:hypothetical protein NECAME_13780 [Necator americanus]|uniref:Uncharacterized protein n=1 Tax=Necator americanus TaxID=51031 RepID=W2SVG3_NECAM|nr:hypothetical protein NECAME_13780 [Necator americanus]ETN72697.1 hypothetical protein NECAME_13780 [Necator americanus]